MSEREVFDQYVAAALTGLLANPNVVFDASDAHARVRVIRAAFRYAEDVMVVRADNLVEEGPVAKATV